MDGIGAWGAFLRGLAEFFYPPRANCLGCADMTGQEDGWLCDQCEDELVPLSRFSMERCQLCGRPLSKGTACTLCAEWPEGVIAFARYAHFYVKPVRGLIHHLKYRGVYRLRDWMGMQLANTFIAECFELPDVIIAVPMNQKRLLERGFNHSDVLAQALGKQLDVPVLNGAIERVRYTKQQAQLSKLKRMKNVQGAFWANDRVNEKSILLVDDVLTTGNTAIACALALKQAGAKRVDLITVAGPSTEKEKKRTKIRKNVS